MDVDGVEGVGKVSFSFSLEYQAMVTNNLRIHSKLITITEVIKARKVQKAKSTGLNSSEK